MADRYRKIGDEEQDIEERVQVLIERGLQRHAQGEVLAALADWEHALALDPDSEQARQCIAELGRDTKTRPHQGALPGIVHEPLPHEDTAQEHVEHVEDAAGAQAPSPPLPSRHTIRAATDWDETWTREPTMEAHLSALAPTMELVLPEQYSGLFGGTGQRAQGPAPARAAARPAETEEPLAHQPHAVVPPVVIEERGAGHLGAHHGSDEYPTDDLGAGGAALGEQQSMAERAGSAPTLSMPATSRTETLELFGAGPTLSIMPAAPSQPAASSVASSVAEELLAELDEDAPAGEDADAALHRRVSWLIDRAVSECVVGIYDVAITALELAMNESPDSAIAQKIIHRRIDTILDIYEHYLDNPAAVPTLAISPSELREHAIDNRAAFLLSRIDGVLTVEDILDVSGMPRLEAYRYLCSMLRRGILTLC